MSDRKEPVDKILLLHHAPAEILDWARKFDTLDDAWQACTSPEWMLWMLETFGYDGDRKLRLFATSCALRTSGRWDDPQAGKAIDVATKVGGGTGTRGDLRAAFMMTSRAIANLTDRADYSESMAAAAQAALATTRDRAMDAARAAAAESRRALWWDAGEARGVDEESTWQANELRRILGADIGDVFVEVRKATRGQLPIL